MMRHVFAKKPTVLGHSRAVSARLMSAVPKWATVDPKTMSGSTPAVCHNLVGGDWQTTPSTHEVIDPLNGEPFIIIPDVTSDGLAPFINSMKSCPKTGLHNPVKNVERYVMLGEVCQRTAQSLRDPDTADFFKNLIQRVVPKHDVQAAGEVTCVRKWMESYSGDQVRNLARSTSYPGDRVGQTTNSHRYPFGATAVITPFNFPLEIPALQAMSSLFMGNKVVTKVDEKVAIVYEQFIRLMIDCGLPQTDMDYIYSSGPVMNELLVKGDSRMTLFTGSQAVAEKLTLDLKGKVKLEDAGFDWKILGPDPSNVDYVAWQSDQDAYAFTGQKCSAQSILFMHENWVKVGIEGKLKERAEMRTFKDYSLGPILSWDNTRIKKHINDCLAIPGARLAFGGEQFEGGASIPACYGSIEATAVFVPIEQIVKPEYFPIVTTELFGPFQIITEFADEQLPMVLECCERMENHLTAAIVSNDQPFCTEVVGKTVNGTTYTGLCARTTGAPQNHWFGPSGDPRSAGIHTPEAIKLVWSGHREIINDFAPPTGWAPPKPT